MSHFFVNGCNIEYIDNHPDTDLRNFFIHTMNKTQKENFIKSKKINLSDYIGLSETLKNKLNEKQYYIIATKKKKSRVIRKNYSLIKKCNYNDDEIDGSDETDYVSD